ncbi:MAG: hypothetical protein A2Y77_10020 [Planctomycetes bacterium RBG_13_62_9]|nr:MAG: hypothetical protein A2Y77_10020 [Planctomycetes bacterium RBG_13_62_9]
MKDPLQTEQTPFETLGVEPGASRTEVQKALVDILATESLPANEAKKAFDALSHPLEQAKRLMLQYPAQGLQELTPNPMRDTSVLSPGRRAETAAAWQRQLSRTFPDLRATHCLGVLWYWWTLHEEMRVRDLIEAGDAIQVTAEGAFTKRGLLQAACRAAGIACSASGNRDCTRTECPWIEDCRSSAPPLEEMWRRVIACWSTLAAASEFWRGWPGLAESYADRLRERFLNSLHQELMRLGQYYSRLGEARKDAARDKLAELAEVGRSGAETLRKAGIGSLSELVRGGVRPLSELLGIGREKAHAILTDARRAMLNESSLSAQYRTLDLMLTTEMETAVAMAGVGMRTAQGAIRCGTLMLQDLGLLDAVQAKVRDTLKANPTNKGLRRLDNALSRHFSVTVLIHNDRPAEALQVIEQLPAEKSRCPEVLRLKVQALDGLARQRHSLGQMEDALFHWAEALRCADDRDVTQSLRDDIVSCCKSYAATAMRRGEWDRGVSLMEMAMGLVEHKDLQLLLGEFLYRHAIRVFQGLQEGRDGLRRVILQPDLPILRKILAELNRAAQLGVGSATKDAKMVEELISTLDQ